MFQKKQLKTAGTALLLAGVLLAGAGCGQVRAGKKVNSHYVVGVVVKSDTTEYWMSVLSGMQEAAADYDMEIVTLAPDSELEPEIQEKQVEKMIAQDVDALAISPMDSYDTPDYLQVIEEKAIPAVTFDTSFEESVLPSIGIGNYSVGYQLAEILAREMEHQGKVGVVTGNLSQNVHKERLQGFQDYMEKEPEMSVTFVESGYSIPQMSEQKVRELLKEYPETNGIFATSAVAALGFADELAGKGIPIVCIDAQENSLNALERGEISALAAQSGYAIGYETIHYLQQLRNGEELEKQVSLQVEMLTAENVEEYRKQNEDQKYME